MTEPADNNAQDAASVELTPAMFHILLALADGKRHGYAIMQEVERSTHGEIRLPPGTLYRSIKRLLDQGWIEECESPAGEAGDERRRYYEICAAGHDVAANEARRLAEIVGLARAKNLIDGSGRA